MDEIKTFIASELKRLFRVEVKHVQLPTLDFSNQYKEAVNRATLARSASRPSRIRERAKVEAETAVVRAKGEAGESRGYLTCATGAVQSRG